MSDIPAKSLRDPYAMAERRQTTPHAGFPILKKFYFSLDLYNHNGYIVIMTPQDLKKWREQTGYSQGQLAKALGVTTGTVSRWERGTSPLPSFLLLALKQLEMTDDPTQRRKRKPKGTGKVRHKRALE